MTENKPSRFGYSIVASAFGVQAVAIGLSMTAYPIFIESLELDLGATRTQTSFGVPLIVAGGALVAPFVGRAVDRGSPRRVMITGAVIMMLGLLCIAAAPTLGWAAAAWVCLVGTGQALLGSIPAMTVIANWFVARRATMIAIAATGTTLGGGIVPPVGELLIQSLGWRTTVACMGLAAATIGIPIVWFGIRKSPEEVGAYPDGAAEPPPTDPLAVSGASAATILGDWRFWPLAVSFAALLGLGIGFITHIVPLAAERGISRGVAVGLLSVAAASSALGKLLFGSLTDRIGPRGALMLAVGLQALSWGGLALAHDPIWFIGSATVFTLAVACTVPIQVGFVGALFGRSHFGQATGLVNLFSIFGVFTLAPLIGLGFDRTGNYDDPMLFALAWIAIPACMLPFLRLTPKAVPPRVDPR